MGCLKQEKGSALRSSERHLEGAEPGCKSREEKLKGDREKRVQQRRRDIKRTPARAGGVMGESRAQSAGGGESSSFRRNVSLGFSGMESRDHGREWLRQHL